MKIENVKIHFNMNDELIKSLTEVQKGYLSNLQAGSTLSQLVDTYLKHGWLVNFVELVNLVELLVDSKIIVNPVFTEYFKNKNGNYFKEQIVNFFSLKLEKEQDANINLSNYPFFRNLPLPILQQFTKFSQKLSVPVNTMMTEQGKTQRDMYILVSGEALVYKTNNLGERFLISEIEQKSVFGEVGFLLGEPRSADVITKTVCQVIQIKFNEDFFNKMIKKEIAESLKKRFWMLHALTKSKYFKDLPEDVFDSLIFAGKTITVTANTILFTEGEIGSTYYVIIQGSVLFSKSGKVINVLGQGDGFGEIALFYSQGVRTASAMTQRECIFAVIERDNLYRILGNNILLGKELQLIAEARLRKDQERIS